MILNECPEGATLTELRETVLALFNCKEFFIQLWDDIFKCYVDIDSTDIIKGGTKLHIVEVVTLIPVQLDSSTVQPSQAGDTIPENDDEMEMPMDRDSEDDVPAYQETTGPKQNKP